MSVSKVEKVVETLPDKSKDTEESKKEATEKTQKTVVYEDWMVPIEFQSDIGRIHEKAGFTTGGE